MMFAARMRRTAETPAVSNFLESLKTGLPMLRLNRTMRAPRSGRVERSTHHGWRHLATHQRFGAMAFHPHQRVPRELRDPKAHFRRRNMNIKQRTWQLCPMIIGIAMGLTHSQQADAVDSGRHVGESVDGYSPVLVLSKKMGDVGQEAVGMGLPVLRDKNLVTAPSDMMLYVDVDSIRDADYRGIFDLVRQQVLRGAAAVIETSEFKFERMHAIVAAEFPTIKPSSIDDVAVMIRLDNGVVKAERVDPSELAMHAGVPFESTTAGRYLAAEDATSRDSAAHSKAAPPSSISYTLTYAAKAYESTPTSSDYNLKYNGTYVDVWKKKTSPTGKCIVAWRGTEKTNLWDIYADLRSQLSWSNTKIDNAANLNLKGGKGFVNRLHAYDDTVSARMTDNLCTDITVTGHSLGGAVAQIHALQLYISDGWWSKLKTIVAWNPPRVVDEYTHWWYENLSAGYTYAINCRNHDWLVNPLPTGLYRMATQSSTPIAGCTHVGPGTYSANPNTNHDLSKWWAQY
jgi:hypothetical protein